MTRREFMTRIITGEATQEELVAFAQKEIETLDHRNALRSSKPTKKQVENEKIKALILEACKGEGKLLTSVIAEKIGISTSKASALCRQLVDEEKMKVEEVKVPKKGALKAYTVIE